VVFQVVIVSGKGLAFSWATLMERAQERQSPAAHQEQANNVNTYNILLLGPTGVGKSTFINALYNYLVYPTLDDTLKGGVQSLEFTSSKFVRGVLDKKTVHVGNPNSLEDTGGTKQAGSSCTQKCKACVFPSESCLFV
jgi:hypothetical protein